MKSSLSEYCEEDFLKIIKQAFSPDKDEHFLEEIVIFLNENTVHPDGSDLIIYPFECGIQDSPEAVVEEIKRYYAEQGVPCFKSSCQS